MWPLAALPIRSAISFISVSFLFMIKKLFLDDKLFDNKRLVFIYPYMVLEALCLYMNILYQQ